MKKIILLTALIITMVMVTTVQAEVKAGSISFTPFVGGYFFEKNQNFKDSVIGGLRAGYNFTEHIGMEGFVSYLRTEIQDIPGEPGHNVYSGGIEGLYHFLPEGRFVPFVAVGVGGIHYGYPEAYRLNKFAFDYGAGAKLFLTDNIALRADVRHVLPMNDRYNDLLCTLGINFSFGGHKKQIVEVDVEEPPAPAEELLDADKDGIPDNLDKCPGTPAGVAVDKNGCPPDSGKEVVPLDSDRDGVPDNLDKCPGTPASLVVDKDGCLPDSDKDGVPDYLDKCPGTPAGWVVDKNGCPPPPAPAVEKKQNEQEKVFMALNVEFDTNKTVINKKYHKEIKKVAHYMKVHPDTIAVMVGHTDSVEKSGNQIKSKKFAIARANSIRLYMIKTFGIDKSRITAVGYGLRKPIAGNDTKKGRQKNRRVQVFIETVDKK
ncbi:MAG: outer membrane beta-barrel domain-containing protein [Deltaproteobacteria bacterium HGW-Deltaproteobacteria-13]|nr:MAG: outer membrane beta-barrel domain-containing protein [Deltaproteobacteria bacterium HGW-Deltaproteobacteria-13]